MMITDNDINLIYGWLFDEQNIVYRALNLLPDGTDNEEDLETLSSSIATCKSALMELDMCNQTTSIEGDELKGEAFQKIIKKLKSFQKDYRQSQLDNRGDKS